MGQAEGDARNRNVRLAISALCVVFLISFVAALATGSGPAYGLSGAALLFLFGLYCVEILGLRIGGSQLILERQIQAAQEENKRLKEATEALLRSYYVLLDSTYRPMMGGPTVAQLRMINDCLAPVRDLFPQGLQEDTLRRAAECARHEGTEAQLSPLERQVAAGMRAPLQRDSTDKPPGTSAD